MSLSTRRLRVLLIFAAVIVICFYYLQPGTDTWGDEPPFPHPTHKPPPKDGKVHWVPRNKDRYPVTSYIPLPTGKPAKIPAIQAQYRPEAVVAKQERLERQAAVKESFVHSWSGYKKYAWLRDEVVPVSMGYRDTFGGWAATLVDALDTLWIMGLKEDFEIAVTAIDEIDFTTTEANQINVFETTIRYLGGFLAAYDISGHKYPLLLAKAIEVGDLLMSCFDTPNRMPVTRWDWQHYVKNNKQQASAAMIVSELGSLSLEFTRLSQISGDPKYYDAVQRISDLFEEYQNKTKLPGMWPVIVDAAGPSFDINTDFHFGGMSDSLYEYLPKQYMMLGGLVEQPRKMYETVIEVAKKYMFFRPLNPDNEELLISGELRVANDGRIDLNTRGQHLGCFVGGMVGIGSKIFNRPEELEIAKQITNGCVWAYSSQVNGVAPEIFTVIGCKPDEPGNCDWSEEKWHKAVQEVNVSEKSPGQTIEEQVLLVIQDHRLAPGFTHIGDRRYILRPEAIESVFMMYRLTGDVEWQDKAWKMFESIEKLTRTEIASSAIVDMTSPDPIKSDSMESFWLAETLKYFYLIFSDMDLVSLDDYVLNTEAHPLRRPKR